MNVSHETSALIDFYIGELLRWNRRINLIGKSTEADIRERHIADSLQLASCIDGCLDRWCDLGSGGGLPAIVLAIYYRTMSTEFICVESDRKKASFLSHISRELDLNVRVKAERIENAVASKADIVSARALAPLVDLLSFMERHGTPDGLGLFPKGARYQKEIDRAKEEWRFSSEAIPSRTSEGSFILKIRDIERV